MQHPSTSVAAASERLPAPIRRAALPEPRYAIDGSVGGIVAAAFQWWMADLPRLLLIALLPLAVTALGLTALVLVNILLGTLYPGGPALWGWCSGVAFASLVAVAFSAAGAGQIIATEERANGRPTSDARAAFIAGLAGLRPMLAAWGMLFLACCGGMAVLSATFALVDAAHSQLVRLASGAVLVAAAVPFAWLALRLSLLMPVLILEERGLWDGVRRSFRLSRGFVGTILGASVVMSVCVGAAWLAMTVMTLLPLVGPLCALGGVVMVPPLLQVFTFALYAAALQHQDLERSRSS